ncbi:methionine ABC transporter ATP-binding protein [Microbacterium sp. AISO3]|jgi:D-methionine transport system permease protein|uniref:D-methionine transport system permease protein n=1 Tax=Microbacterium paludicola TaxID=300019 RepID=A0ABU1HYM6_9MICO|nr:MULTISPECIES: ABC transporter permease subunit [Microbacterium]APF33314.1 methionine ABC transporter ATP-binding protein [Microbacterium paludicola]MDR6166362.1 D-methionine transport system permease protein [Microbacterium paludicola]OWP22877.1 methionine ABC transporter ATP-binding protein [Microbacterium sp. AISO3]POX66996.1 methionine ABC transporter ATP-binding protein [Microbacterium sp. Ru50]QCR40382.1 methionine ABC transporter ATP-binding protein [Microbacterium sp. SGAir0570]
MSGLADSLGRRGEDLLEALGETGYMLLVSLAAAVLLGLPLGMLVYLTRRGGAAPNRAVWWTGNLFINVVRSFPFLLLVVFLVPVTRLVYGTTFGTPAATFSLCFVAVAIYARLVEQILREISPGIPRVARTMGATLPQTIVRFLLPEAFPGLVYALTSATISLLSYSTVLGVVGGGGIGDFALRYGYQEYDYPLMYFTIAVILVVVLVIQSIGHRLSIRLDHR